MVIAWLVAQVLELIFDSFGTPDWVMKTVLVLLAAGMPFALFFAWAFEITPDGVKRTDEAESSLALLIRDYRENGLYQQAQVYAQWGDSDKAIQTLSESHEYNDPGTSQLLVDPLLDPIREVPQFAELLKKTGFQS